MAKVTLRYWAALRAAAGASQDVVDAATLSEALEEVRRRHAAMPRFASVLGICSVVVDETPVGSRPHTEVVLVDGATVDLLPPFAGG